MFSQPINIIIQIQHNQNLVCPKAKSLFSKGLIKLSLLVFNLLFIVFNANSQDCYPSGVQFNSQAELNDFILLNPNCTKIIGDVIMNQTDENIYSLAPLINITEIGGKLWFTNHAISTLAGLENLTKIKGDLIVRANNINTFLGLDNLKEVQGDVNISGLDLFSMKGLESLQKIGGSLNIIQSNNLNSLVGFNSLERIEGDLEIENGDDLDSYFGLSNLSYIGGNFYNSLESYIGLESLDTIIGFLDYFGNPVSFDGLEGLKYVGGNFRLANYSVDTENQFPLLNEIGGDLNFSASNGKNFNGFENLTKINGDLNLSSNSLDTIKGFESLSHVNGKIEIRYGKNSLEDIQAFKNLLHVGTIKIGGSSFQEQNDHLNSLDAFNNLISVADSIYIDIQPSYGQFKIFKNLKTVGASIYLNLKNPTNFTGLEKLETIGGDFHAICGFSNDNFLLLNNLKTAGGSFEISGFNIVDIPNLSTVAQDLLIKRTFQLNKFNALTKIGNDLRIHDLSNDTIDLFPALDTVENDFIVTENSYAQEVRGFDQLKYIGGDFLLSENGYFYDDEINGDLYISGFSNLVKVKGSFKIYHAGKITPNAFESLKEIGNSLVTFSPYKISGYNKLESVGGSLSVGADEEINGFENLLDIGEDLNLDYHPLTQNTIKIIGFENLSNVGNNLNLANITLEAHNKLSSLSQIGGSISIKDIESSVPISFLDNVTSVGGSFVFSSSNLDQISILNSLGYLQDDIEFYYNTFKSANLMSSITEIYGRVSITGNFIDASGTGIFGFDILKYIDGQTFIKNNNDLPNIDFFGELTEINNDLLIENQSVNSIDGFKNLEKVNGNLELSDLTNLSDLEAFSNLKEINGHLFIDYCKGLQSLEGIQNIDPFSISNSSSNAQYDEDLVILENSNLSFCNVKSICEFLKIPDREARIEYNASGCTNESELDCETFSLSGIVYYDTNQNGIQDQDEFGIENIDILIEPDNYIYKTNSGGEFYKFVEENILYSIGLNAEDEFLTTSTPSEYSLLFIGGDPENSKKDFGVIYNEEKAGGEISITSTRTVCNTDAFVHVNMINQSSDSEKGMLVFEYDPKCVYINSSLPPASVDESNYTITYKVDNLNPFESLKIDIELKMPDETFTGEIMQFNSSWLSESSDLNINKEFETLVRCSYDPNDKLVYPIGVQDENYVLIGDTLEYTIRFQNTGNDTAYNVTIVDQLSNNLDMESLHITNSSHSYNTRIQDNRVEFNFNNIYLPDSITDETNSHGFISFRVSHNENIETNTIVINKADIIFDLNAPIITNATSTTFVDMFPTTSTKNIEPQISIYPNPSQGIFSIKSEENNDDIEYQVFDATGKKLFGAKHSIIDLSEYQNGLYIVRIRLKDMVKYKFLTKV